MFIFEEYPKIILSLETKKHVYCFKLNSNDGDLEESS